MAELSEIKKDIERQIKDLRKDMDAEFRLVHVEMRRLEEKVDSRFREMEAHLRAIRDLLEPLRSIPERVARLEGAQEAE